MTYELHHGDALAVLRDLPTASVDALVTDPPYSSGGMVRGDRTNGDLDAKYVRSTSQGNWESFTGDNRDQRGYGYWCALWLSECVRIVKPGGAVLLFTDWRQLPSTTDALQAGGFVWRGIVPWYKPGARPALGKFTSSCEYVVWGSNGPMRQDTGCLPGFYSSNTPRERDHMTQKPLDVMRGLVRIASKSGTVLDPFMGAGTTGVAALLEGRDFVGVELTRHYHDVAATRLVTAEQCYVDDGEQLVLELEVAAAAIPPLNDVHEENADLATTHLLANADERARLQARYRATS